MKCFTTIIHLENEMLYHNLPQFYWCNQGNRAEAFVTNLLNKRKYKAA